MYGIENLKTVGKFVISLVERVDEVTAPDSQGGKKVTTGEIIGSIPVLGQVPALIKAVPHLKEEITEIDESEEQELRDWFIAEFDLRNDKAEALVKQVISIALSLRAVYSIK